MDRDPRGWFKSSFSAQNQGCVEVLIVDDQILVRHSKAPFSPALIFDRVEWDAFLRGVRDGQFEMPA